MTPASRLALPLALAALLATPLPAFAAAARLTPEQVNDPALDEIVGPRASAAAVLRAQILLERAHFSAGEIDGSYGSNTRLAISGLQKANDLEPTGRLDAAGWALLNREGAPALVEYTLTEADVTGPFVEIPDDMMQMAELDRLGYRSVEEALAERFHVSPKLLRRLNPGVDFAVAGSTLVVPNVESLPELPQAARVVVDRSDSSVALFDASDRMLAQFPASTGSEHDPLPVGEWKINGVALDPTFHYNPALFWDADPEHAKATLAAGPNNPVGVAWIDLSKEHYGIHGTPEPSRIGKSQSHGCIRLTNWSARLVATAVSPGLTAVLQE